jgi:hypothetical protein
MDKDAKKIELENQKAALEEYLNHPVTKEVMQALKDGQESLVRLICDQPVENVGTFFAHFEAVGHLRGLRKTESLITTSLGEVKEQLRELE